MKGSEWEALLVEATEEVKAKVSAVSAGGEAGTTLGTGAAGDQTLLADKVAEDVLLRALGKAGGVRVLSEEAGGAGDPRGETLAIVDPLDGSSNFGRGIPFYCTSVAIVEGGSANGATVGVVRDLVNGDAYTAVRGMGAKKNGRKISCSGEEDIAKAVIALDLSRAKPEAAAGLVPLESSAARIVHYGANALELCYLAEGRVDAFVDLRGRMRVTDTAAAALVAQEAGATVTGPSGHELAMEFDLQWRHDLIGASSPRLHQAIFGLLRR